MERAKPSPEALEADRALVSAALAGDAEARRAFGDRMRCLPRILRILNARRGGLFAESELDDLAQEVAIRVLAKLGDFHGQATIEAWIHRFAFHVLMNSARSRGRRNALFEAPLSAHDEPSSHDPDPSEDYRQLELAIEALDETEAEVVRLKHYAELSFSEIGTALRISPNTAKTRYYRALQTLESRLAPTVGGGVD